MMKAHMQVTTDYLWLVSTVVNCGNHYYESAIIVFIYRSHLAIMHMHVGSNNHNCLYMRDTEHMCNLKAMYLYMYTCTHGLSTGSIVHHGCFKVKTQL